MRGQTTAGCIALCFQKRTFKYVSCCPTVAHRGKEALQGKVVASVQLARFWFQVGTLEEGKAMTMLLAPAQLHNRTDPERELN